MRSALSRLLLLTITLFCHTNLSAQAHSADELNSIEPISEPVLDSLEYPTDTNKQVSFENLRKQEATLEKFLLDLEGAGPWDFQRQESLLALARVRKDLGKVDAAKDAYDLLLQNLRINRGLYDESQLPVLMNIVQWYLGEGDYETAHELGDWAAFLISRAYSDKQIDEQLAAYSNLINIRLGAPRAQDCFKSNLNDVQLPSSQDCLALRRGRAEHFIGAFQLQRTKLELVDQQFESNHPILMQEKARLARISIITAGIVNGVDFEIGHFKSYELPDSLNNTDEYFSSPNMARRRYDPEYYYLTSRMLIRQLQRSSNQAETEH